MILWSAMPEHTTLTRQESDMDYKRLFGVNAKDSFHKLRLDKLRPTDGQGGLLVHEALYVLPWRRVFALVDAMEVVGAIMQSEWHRITLDVPELHAELSPGMLHPDPSSSLENIHRVAFLGSSRLPLLAHLPSNTNWYKEMLELAFVKTFRMLKEYSWGRQLSPCSTVGAAAATHSAQDSFDLSQGALRDHVSRLQHRTELFNHTVVVVGATTDGPFTIWDGNHRSIALALTHPDEHLLLAYVGISASFASPHTGSLFCP